MSQLKHITFRTDAGGTQTLKLQDYVSEDRVEAWSEPDQAISGKLRHNLRGTRGFYKFSYTHSTEAAAYRDLLNNILSDLTSGDNTIELSEGKDMAGTRIVVPTKRFRQMLEYVNQITGFKPALEFYDVELGIAAGSYVVDGYIEQGYVV